MLCRHRKEVTDGFECHSPYVNNAPVLILLSFCETCSVRDITPPPDTDSSGRVILAKRKEPCLHSGKIVLRPTSCQGTWVRKCEVHGECTLVNVNPTVQNCQDCSDYEADA